MEKEYGKAEIYYPFYETQKSMINSFLHIFKSTLINQQNQNVKIDENHQYKKIGNSIYEQRIKKSIANNNILSGLGNYEFNAWFDDGVFISFKNCVYLNGERYFRDIYFKHCINGNQQYFRSYTNEEIIDMQTNAPDHELLQAINKVFEAFAEKGTSEKVSDESKPDENNENKQMQ